MTPVSKNAALPVLGTRRDYFDYFGGLAPDTVEQLEERKLQAGLQKSYLLETVTHGVTANAITDILARSELNAIPLSRDKGCVRLANKDGASIAILEQLDERFLALYTLLPAGQADKFTASAVSINPLLDHLWLPSQSFLSIWQKVLATNSGRRYGRITFEHESIFEEPEDADELAHFDNERRTSRFTMVDQLEVISQQMAPLSETYAPLASITHLRIPSTGRGGHDLYYNGKVTNRSNSFINHRSELMNVVSMYRSLTTRVEERLWVSSERQALQDWAGTGAVAEIIFSKSLSEATFRRWMLTIFNNQRNRFRLTGFPTWLSAKKVHANAIDQHLWQPLILEFTTERVIAILPSGTCGNSINRLISNIQRYIDPKVQAFIGGVDYAELIPRMAIKA